MIFCAPIYKKSISPFFDTAQVLIFIQLKGLQEISRYTKDISSFPVTEKAIFLKNNKPDIFVCNAISRFWYLYLIANLLEIYPFIQGDIEDVIHRIKKNELEKRSFPVIPPFSLIGTEEKY